MPRETLSMNVGWRFHLGDIEERNFEATHKARYQAAEWLKAANNGVAKVGYPDQSWKPVDLPHDWVIEGEFTPKANLTHGSLPVGIGWYRKTFALPEADKDRSLRLEFDGVFRDSSVWLNGHHVGHHLSGYTSFAFDITDMCNYGGLNALAVRVDASEFELWSYEGGGIYRDVRLVKTHRVHVQPWGTFVKVAPPIRRGALAKLKIATDIANDTGQTVKCEVRSEVVDASGRVVARVRSTVGIKAERKAEGIQVLAIKKPVLWDIDAPHLYRLRTTIAVGGRPADACETDFGVRAIRFDAAKGFFLNGKPLKLKGTCHHQDSAGVGVAVPLRLQEWRIRKLKAMGSNALRTSHNPPDPALLDACDRLGMLVMDETRLVGSSPEILGQLEDLVRRDRNHPSVILWSLGNEEMNIQGKDVGIRMLRKMQNIVHRLDPTRPATYGMNCDWFDICDRYAEAGFKLDVYGGNYACKGLFKVDGSVYDDFHRKHPTWPFVATESGGSCATRGLYDVEVTEPPLRYDETTWGAGWLNPKRKNIVSGYGETVTGWGYSIEQTWKDCAKRPFVSGTFPWTGFDYRGETFPCSWPAVVTRYGIVDLCGFPKDAFFYYRAWWQLEPVLHIFPHWNWAGKEGQDIDVWCYSNCAAVELCLNGASLGRKAMEPNGHLAWEVPYAPGRLLAKGFDAKGRLVLRTVVETTGAAAGIRLTPDRKAVDADGEDVIVVDVAITDAEGRVMPLADNEVTFDVTGPARILGVGNGNPCSHEPDKANRRRAYHGLCQVILQASRTPGEIVLRATSPGLSRTQVTLKVRKSKLRPLVPSQNANGIEPKRTDALIDGAL